MLFIESSGSLWLSWLLTRQPHGCHAGKGQEQNSGKQKGSRINCAETGSPQSKVRRVEEQRTHSELSCSCPAKHLAVLCLCTLPGAVSIPGDFPSVILWDQQAQSLLENSGQHCDCEWAFRTVSYGYNIYESKLPRACRHSCLLPGVSSACLEATCHSQKVRSVSNPEQPSLELLCTCL